MYTTAEAYDAECALRSARQTGIAEWEDAARVKLLHVLASLHNAETVAQLPAA